MGENDIMQNLNLTQALSEQLGISVIIEKCLTLVCGFNAYFLIELKTSVEIKNKHFGQFLTLPILPANNALLMALAERWSPIT